MPVIQTSASPQIDFLILADAVECVNGKLYMLGGGWAEVRSANYPANVTLGIAARVSAASSASPEEYEAEVIILSEDNTALVPSIKAKVIKKSVPKKEVRPGKFDGSNFALNLMIQIPQPGTYRVRITCGEAVREVTFNAVIAAQ